MKIKIVGAAGGEVTRSSAHKLTLILQKGLKSLPGSAARGAREKTTSE